MGKGSKGSVIPAPPAGFELEPDAGIPPPPPGFELESSAIPGTEKTGLPGIPKPPALPMREFKTPQGFAKNVPKSAGRLVGGMASALGHPLDTGEALLKTTVGTFQAMTPETPASVERGVGKEYVPHAKAAAKVLKDRYGSMEAIGNTLYEDPVGAAADVSAVAGGVGGALRAGSGLARSAGATRTASGLGKAASVAGTVSDATNPMIGLAKAVKPVARAAGKVGSEALGLTTGAGGEAIRTAVKNPSSQFKAAMRGDISEVDIVDKFKTALQNVRDLRGERYRERLNDIGKGMAPPATVANQAASATGKVQQTAASLTTPGRAVSKSAAPGTSVTLDLTPVRNEMMSQLQSFGAHVTPNGLDLSRVPIANPSERKLFEGIVHDVVTWGSKPGDLTPLGVDTLKRRIGDFYSDSSSARAFVQGIKKSVEKVLNDNVPGYKEMTREYAAASDFIQTIEKNFSLGKNADKGSAIRKLSTALKQNNEYRKVLTEALGQFTSDDLKGQLAGYHLSQTAPRGLAGVTTGAGIMLAISQGMVHPAFAAELLLTSPRAMGEVLTAMGKTQKLAKAGGKVAINPALYRAGTAGQAVKDQLETPDPVQ